MTTRSIIPSAAAIVLLCSLQAGAQTVVRERTTTVPAETTTTIVEPIEAAGTITEFAPDTVVLRIETSTAPIRYSVAKTIEYVDDTGTRVDREIIKSGMPVTVRYIKEGDRMVVNRVVVHRTTNVVPETVTTQKTTTTTTTTEGRDKDKDRHHERDKNKDKDKD